MNRVFVCGGMYATHLAETPFRFGLVRPTKGLPYVAKTEKMGQRLFNLCQHHSHLFELNMDTGKVTIWQTSGEARGVSSSHPDVLPDALMTEVKLSLQQGGWEV